MGLLMNEALKKSEQKTLVDIPNATFSPALEAGAMPCASPDGPMMSQSGRVLALASPSQSREKGSARKTPATCGLPGLSSSPSAALQSALASRLRQRLGEDGSPEYLLTWKEWAMPSREPICALRASARRTSDKGYGGWRSPGMEQATGGCYTSPEKVLNRIERGHQVNLKDQATLAGWKTCHATDGEGGVMEIRPGKAGHYNLRDIAQLAGWGTCRVEERPRSEKFLAGACRNMTPSEFVAGWNQVLSSVETGKAAAYQLNPHFSRWLMGFPVEWDSCGVMAMQSCHKSRRNLSKRQGKQLRA